MDRKIEELEKLEKEVKRLNHVIDILIGSNKTHESYTASINFGLYNVVAAPSGNDGVGSVDKQLRESIDRLSAEW